MIGHSIRKFIGNLVGACIPDCRARRRIRVNIVAPLWRCLSFVRSQHQGVKDLKLEKFYGLGGKGVVIGVNGDVVYKFSCMADGDTVAQREYAIVSYFKNISPIPTPGVTLLRSSAGLVRRYKYIHGTALSDIAPDKIIKNADKLGRQIAEFLYVIGSQDPAELKQYKAYPNDIPRMFYGWNHMDFDNVENFIVNPDTMDIIAIIDWENAQFGDFYNRLYRNGNPAMRVMFDAVIREYTRMYDENRK